MSNSNRWGLLPWGAGYWGIPYSSTASTNIFINIVNVQPSAGSFYIARNQTFTFSIKTRYALNPNTTYVFLDNKLVINGAYFNTVDFAIAITDNVDGISKDFTITPNYLFRDRDVFSLQISATDIYSNPSPPFFGGYIVVDTRPPLLTPIYPLDGYVNVPIDLTIHFIINQLSAPNVGLDVSTLNVYVDNTPAIIAGSIQESFNGEYSALNIPNNINDPIEVLLDYTGRYPSNDIIPVSVSVRERGVIPSNNGSGQIFNESGILVAQNIVMTTINKLDNGQYSLILQNILSNYVLPQFNVYDGYQFEDGNNNTFSIVSVGSQELIVTNLNNLRQGHFTFITTQFDNEVIQPVFAGYFQGVYLVDNLGDGYHINVTWHPARTTRPDYDLAYLIYYSTTRSDVFYEEPKLITQGRTLPAPETISGADAQLFGCFAQIPLPVGVTYYFGVRATEFPHSLEPDTFPIIVPPDGYGSNAAGRTVIDGYSFSIPPPQVLMQNISGASGITIPAITTGYSNVGGYIIVGSEIMRYTSTILSPIRGFVVPSTGRGQLGTIIQNMHFVGETIKMYYGNLDDNTVIAKNLVSWESPNDPHRTRPDLVTTDFTLEDGYHTGFEFFDYCGYHRFRPDELLNDADNCGTYVGGEYNGHRGMSIYDRMLANEEMLLEVTGEPIILLRRLWSGERCICMTSRKDSAKVRSCALCFGTGYKGGYVQYSNPRRDDHRVMVHFAPADEELGMGPQSGWDQKFKPGNWTLAVPSIKDRDVIIRFDEFGERDWIYVVDAVSRAKSMFGRYARQRIKLSRLDKTDVLYQFKFMP